MPRTDNTRNAPPATDILTLDAAPLTAELKNTILDFNREYQMKGFRYFAKLKLQWEKEHAGRTFPGLCAEVDSISGQMRPLSEQRAWSWGDARALGIWCYFLRKGRIPDTDALITLDDGETRSINLREFYTDYVTQIYTALHQRMADCGGKLPFLVDIDTNTASDDPRNIFPKDDEFIASHVFAINGFTQYGLLRDDQTALDLGMKTLDETFRAAHEFRFVNHLTRKRSYAHSHGTMMVSTGALVDILKTLELLESDGIGEASRYASIRETAVNAGRWTVDMLLGYHWNARKQFFSEYLHPIMKTPYVNEDGHIICDPGHTAEAIGFLAEYSCYLPENDSTNFRFNRGNIIGTLMDMLRFVDQNGYADTGVMFKNIDVLTMDGVVDVIDGGKGYRTAPWWNVRELCAASIKLYQLTNDPFAWDVYRRAFNATYQHYPHLNIGGLMLQTLDADTLSALPFHPATGNLDPMHSPRAREREIEALEKIDLH